MLYSMEEHVITNGQEVQFAAFCRNAQDDIALAHQSAHHLTFLYSEVTSVKYETSMLRNELRLALRTK